MRLNLDTLSNQDLISVLLVLVSSPRNQESSLTGLNLSNSPRSSMLSTANVQRFSMTIDTSLDGTSRDIIARCHSPGQMDTLSLVQHLVVAIILFMSVSGNMADFHTRS